MQFFQFCTQILSKQGSKSKKKKKKKILTGVRKQRAF